MADRTGLPFGDDKLGVAEAESGPDDATDHDQDECEMEGKRTQLAEAILVRVDVNVVAVCLTEHPVATGLEQFCQVAEQFVGRRGSLQGGGRRGALKKSAT